MARILVVDDEKDVIDLLRFLLERDGHRVDTAEDGQQAFERVAAQVPDLIVLDLMMPNVDGYTFADKLVEDNKLKNIPIVILTAKGQMKDHPETHQNVCAYLQKPFDPKELRDLISQNIL